MSEIIDIASFDFDMTAIERAIIDNKKRLETLNASIRENQKTLREQQKAVKETAKEMDAGRAMQEELQQSFESGAISLEDYTEVSQSLAEDLAVLSEEMQNQLAIQDEMVTQNHVLSESVREVQQENRNLTTLMRGGAEEVRGNETAYSDLNKQLNQLKLDAKNLGAEMVVMEQNGEQNTEAYKALKEEWERVSAEANTLNDSFKAIDAAVGDNQRSVGDYRNAINQALGDMQGGIESAFSGDVLGAMEGFQGGLDGIKEGVNGVGKAILANPILAIVASLLYVGKLFYDFNAEIAETNKKIGEMTGNMPVLNDELRLLSNSIETTFGVEKMEAVQNLDTLIKVFGLTSAEAMNAYTDGLVRGGQANEEFSDSIAEYSIFFQRAGYSAQEFMNILNSGIDLKTYKDKLPDAVKEATISLTEATKGTRDALVNAFGASFTDDLLRRVSSGKSTVADALDEIALKAENANLNQQQYAQLTADVFRGAGEDVGGTIVLLDGLAKAQKANNEELTETQKRTLELSEVNLEYERTLDDAFNSGVITDFSKDMGKMWAYTKLGFAKFANNLMQNVTNIFNLMVAGGTAVSTAILNIPTTFKKVVTAMGKDIVQVGTAFTQLGDVIKKGLTGKFDEASAGFDKLKGTVSNFGKNTLDTLKNSSTAVLDTFANTYEAMVARQKKERDLAKAEADAIARGTSGLKMNGNGDLTGDAKAEAERLAKEREKAKKDAEDAEKKRLADLEKARKEKEAELKEASKREMDALQGRADIESELAKQALAKYISDNEKRFESDKTLNKSKLEAQKAFLDEQARLQKEADAKELAGKILSLENQKKEEGITADQIKNIEDNQQLLRDAQKQKDIETDKAVNDAKVQLVKNREDEIKEVETFARAIALQQKLIDMEISHASEFSLRQVQLEADTQQEIDELRKKFGLKLEADAENESVLEELRVSKEELQKEIDATTDADELARKEAQMTELTLVESKYSQNVKAIDKATQDAKLEAYASAFGSIKSLFGEASAVGKAAAIAETTINTYKSATAAYAAGASLGGPLGAVMGPILAGLAVASGLKNIQKITSTKDSFYSGGYTGDGGVHEYAGDVHKGEVVFSQDDVARFGGVQKVEQARLSGSLMMNNMLPSYQGMSGMLPVSNTPTVASSGITQTFVTLAPEAVDEISGAVYAGSQSGIADANIQQAVENGANF